MICFSYIAVFVLGLHSTYERKHVAFGLLRLANVTKDDALPFYHLPANNKISFFFVVK
jgi:hypothetical protein